MAYFDTAILAASFDRRIAPGTDLLDKLFQREHQSQSEKIVFDEILDDEGLASYVSPDIATPDGTHSQVGAKEFKPSYIKERHTIKPAQGLTRQVGEALSGDASRSADAAFYDAIEKTLNMHQNRITRREIQQANELLQTGKVTIEGKNYPKRIVNFNRHADLSDALIGAARWGQSGVSIGDYIEAKSDKMGEVGGAIGKILILGSTAKNAFVNDDKIAAAMDNRRASAGLIEFGTVGTKADSVMRFVGEWGDLSVWKYVQTYKDASGVRQHLFPVNGMFLVDPDEFMGTRCYGAILDTKASLNPLKRFAKVWDEQDPAVTLAMTQSSPLMVPGNIDASFFATVV